MRQEEFERLTGEQKLTEIYKSVDQTKKYFKWTFIITLVFLVLPLVALIFVIPQFIGTMTSVYSGLI